MRNTRSETHKSGIASARFRLNGKIMARDFTLDQFHAICLALQEAGYRMMTVAQYLVDVSIPSRVAVLRHDVDRFSRARLAHGARGTACRDMFHYYFRTKRNVFPA